jgi:hypothetical protein
MDISDAPLRSSSDPCRRTSSLASAMWAGSQPEPFSVVGGTRGTPKAGEGAAGEGCGPDVGTGLAVDIRVISSPFPAFGLDRNLRIARRGVGVAGRHLDRHRATALAHTATEAASRERFCDGVGAGTGDVAQALIRRVFVLAKATTLYGEFGPYDAARRQYPDGTKSD